MRVTPVDFTTGLLNPGLSYWHSSDKTPLSKSSPRVELSVSNRADPVSVSAASVTDSTDGMYVAFTHTSWDSDVAQLTVPYFDALPITTSPPAWITALNLHHKGSAASGGFIAFTAQYYNATRHCQTVQESLVPTL